MSNLERLQSSLGSRYTIDREIGRGGMATVFLARDLRHARQVAIKVLAPELSAALGAERFVKEIELTASLQHPHILPLFDSGSADGELYYVMPFVQGETLRARLDRERQLPIDDAVRIAGEVADALHYAHGLGIIHRDIKPENILLQEGHALVADFGIALAVQKSGGARITQTGVSLGTPQYMSPEQAMGEKALDARSDIWALGAMLYEMLAGAPPFTAPTMQAIVARVLTEEARPVELLRRSVPAHVANAVARALEKLPADRFATAGDFVRALAPTATSGERAVARTSRPSRAPLVVAAVGVVGLAAAFAMGRSTAPSETSAVGRFGTARQVTWEPGLEVSPALSPDGKLVAYASTNGSQSKIFVRPVAGGRAVPLTDDSTAVEVYPAWSRDGSRILYISDRQVFSAPSGGGVPRQEVPRRGGDVEGATWSPDERRIAYVVDDSIFLREASGSSRFLALVFQANLCTWGPNDILACMAGNRWYLKPGMSFGNLAPSWIALVDPSTGTVRGVTDSVASNAAPRWAPDGRTLLYISNKDGLPDIYSLAVDTRGASAGTSRRLTVGLGVNSFTLSADGARLAYSVLTTSSNVWWQSWSGEAELPKAPPTQVTFGQQTIESALISRDGEWLYYDSNVSGNPDIYRMKLPSGEPERLTTTPTSEFSASPSPDNRYVAFHSWRTGSRDIFVMPLDGGPVEQVTHSPEQEQQPLWSPDGRMLCFASQSQPLGVFIATRKTGGGWEVRKRVADGHWSEFSPDSRSISYVSALGGGTLYVVPVDSGAPRALYDVKAPGAPLAEVTRWSADGRTIYFKSHDADGEVAIWSVASTGGVPRRLVKLGDGRMRSDRYGFALSHGRLYYVLFDRQSNVWVMDMIK